MLCPESAASASPAFVEDVVPWELAVDPEELRVLHPPDTKRTNVISNWQISEFTSSPKFEFSFYYKWFEEEAQKSLVFPGLFFLGETRLGIKLKNSPFDFLNLTLGTCSRKNLVEIVGELGYHAVAIFDRPINEKIGETPSLYKRN